MWTGHPVSNGDATDVQPCRYPFIWAALPIDQGQALLPRKSSRGLMEPIDAAAGKLTALLSEIDSYKETMHSEEDTRLKVINRLLIEVLGWPLHEIFTEESSGGGYIDYKLAIDSRARLVVEAKRDGRELGFGG